MVVTTVVVAQLRLSAERNKTPAKRRASNIDRNPTRTRAREDRNKWWWARETKRAHRSGGGHARLNGHIAGLT